MMNGMNSSWNVDTNYPVNIWGALPPIFFVLITDWRQKIDRYPKGFFKNLKIGFCMGCPPFLHTQKNTAVYAMFHKNNWHTIDQVGNILHTVKNMTPEGGFRWNIQSTDG